VGLFHGHDPEPTCRAGRLLIVKIVVSGASGLLGSSLVPALEGDGHDVLRLVRREARGPNEVSWDPHAGTIDAGGLAGVDAAIHLASANLDHRWTESYKREILDSRVSSTGLLAATLARLEPRPVVLVCAGGMGIYGDRGDEILTEESEHGTGFLADVSKAWEAAAEPARAAGVRVVSFRQGIFLSVRGGALKRMYLPFRLGLGGRVGSGRQWWSWVALEDAVAAYRFVLDRDLEGPLHLTSPNPATSAQFTTALGRALHRPTVFPLPGFAAKALFGERAEAVLLEGQRALPRRLLDAGFEFRYPDLDEALAVALTG
jgi:uncharacterized protein (TIGR01777 family)